MTTTVFFKKMSRFLLTIGITTILLSATNALAAGGTLDPTFGSNGVVTTKINGLPSSALEVVLQPDGKIITLGTVKLSDEQSAKVIARYNSNGTLDTSFGVNGVVTVDTSIWSSSIALQTDGKIIVGGGNSGQFAVARYTSAGSLDTSFGTNGIGMFPTYVGSSSYTLSDLVIKPDGGIIMVGTERNQGNFTNIAVARFNSDGSPDFTRIFDKTDFLNNRYNSAAAVVIQPDNKVVVSGDMMDDDADQQLTVMRLGQDGWPDKSGFGTNGKGTVQVAIPNFSHSNGALALQPDGKILAAGSIVNDDNKPQDGVLVRLLSNGSVDTTFGGTGIVIADFGASEAFDDFVIQPDGKIIAEGKTTSLDASDFLLLRYNSDGSLDTSFGTNGKLISDFGNSTESVSGIVQQADGKVIVSGTSGENAILARYTTGASGTTTSVSFKSFDAHDGWILESGEFSNAGGSLDKLAKVFFVGDDDKDRQYRSILSFDTNSIPDNATITSAQVKIKRQTVVGADPFNTHGNLLLEIRKGSFSNDIGLTLADFSAIADSGPIQDTFSAADSSWYSASLSNINLGLINKYGATQFRLLFSKDDNDNLSADYIKFFSGDSTTSQPELFVTYSSISSGGTGNQAPVIYGGSALSVSIPENTTTVTGFTAIDPDGQPVTYSLSGTDAGKFSITPTGILSFVTAPDFETIPSGTVYHVTAQVSDGSLTSTQDISVTVTPVDEFEPVITSNGGEAVANISLPENTLDVTTITVVDADLPAPTIEYVVGGVDWSLFTIDQATGKLSFLTAPSYNAPNDAGLDHVYNINVQVSSGVSVALQDLVITITNPNPAPVSMLDSTFGTNGVITTKFNGLPSSTRDIVLQPDGKIIVLGNRQSTRIIARYNNNGSLDNTFGSNGITSIDFPSFSGITLALQPDGKLIVGGLNQGGFAVIRYNSNGSLDTAFGANGMGFLETDSEHLYSAQDVTVQPDGKIVLVGDYQFRYGNHIDFQIARFNSDGTRDVINTIDWGDFPASRYNWGKAVVLQPDNKIIMSGDMIIEDVDKNDISLTRLTPNLRTDRSTFGANGKGTVITRLDYFQNSSGALALQPDGKIVVAGTIFNQDMDVPQNLALARFNSDGTLDTAFGGTGIVVTDFGAQESTANLVIQASGKIIVAGTTSNLGASDFLLVRYNSDGTLDTSFGANGKVTTDFGNSVESASGIVQQPDGRVIVSGTSGENAILARYNTGASSGPATSLTFNSVGAHDGWILESGENSNKGGTLDKISNVFYVGDDAKDRQYRSILSFDTNSVPDNATITSAQIKIKKQGLVGADPFNTHGNLLLEIRNGTFNNDIALTLEDFSVTANAGSTQDTFSASDGGWYTANLSSVNLGLVNKSGATQFRLLFSKDDNDDLGADYVKFFSGNAASDLPQLIVTYSTAGGGTTNQAPIIYGGSALSISIPENTTTIAGVTALDPDGQPVTYSLSGTDAGKFSITPTGILSFVTAPDFETIPSGTVYHVTVQASDGSLTSTQDISVTVTPVNEFTPVVTSNGGGTVINISVPENTIDVTTITVTDADLPAQTIEYVFAGGADDFLFTIDQATGKLSFLTAPSYNAPNDAGLDHVYNVKFEINDGEFGTTLELVITILNPNSTPTGEMLDPTFGTNGIITTKFGDRPSSIGKIGLQPDGKIVMLGSTQVNNDGNAYTSERFLIRYTRNGALDTSFGTNGIAPIEVESFNASTIKVLSDGKILIGGQYPSVVRYNSNGALDTSFGTNGLGMLDFPGYHGNIRDMAVQPDGKIVLIGDQTTGDANYTEFFIARFTSSGQVDGTFVANGFLIIDEFPNYRYNYGQAVVIQADGKIVVSGNMMDNDGKANLALARLNQDGSFDKTGFGTNGRGTVSTLIPSDFQTSRGALALQADGKIVATGTANDNLILVRYNTNGMLDGAFGGTGIVTTDFGNKEAANDLVIQADGKILVVGSAPAPEYMGFLLVRYNPDGSLDTSFGTNGKTVTSFGSSNATATEIVQQPDGKVLVNGFSGVNSVSWDNAYLVRYDIGMPVSTNTLSFKSVGSHDGWILESGENTNQGGTLEKVSNALFVGDDAKDRQYRSILSFDTNSIPDNATITSAQLRIRKQGVVGNDPIDTHGDLLLEIRNGTFSNSVALNIEDFAAPANIGSTQDKFLATGGDWYVASLSNINLDLVNKYGYTQFRLLFSKDDNDDLGADYDRFFSGNSTSDQPELVIAYSTSGASSATSAAAAPIVTVASTLPTPTPTETPTPPVIASTPTQFTALHQFGSQADNGRVPYGMLVQYNGVLYGTTTYGGPPYNVAPTNPANKGNVFKMNTDGSGFTVLHEFMGGDNDGWKPWSGLAISGDMIYGSTVYGGPHGESGGVLYEMNINGGGFRVLHAFGEPGDGFGGSTSPILVGDTLYGITRWGGNGTGTLYSYNTTTEVYTQLYRFAANSSDGNAPLGTLTAANDGYLYGLTWLGGANNMGTLFRIKPDGSAFETLHHFAGGAQGKYPYDTLVFDGNRTLYGTTLGEYGVNLSDLGAVFKYDIVSRNYSVLRKFAGGANDSGKPNGSVVLSPNGMTLYGTTHGDDAWGGGEFGILYQMNIDGTGFTQLHEFKGGADGATPMRAPLLIDGNLYGMTAYGGAENYGLIYRYQVEDTIMAQRSFAALSVNTFNPTFTSGDAITIPENNLALITVTATDADVPTQTLSYSISGGPDSALFSINPSTGELVFVAAPNYEVPADAGLDNTYDLTIQVSDGVTAVTQDFAVTITAVNDNNPTITSNNAISIPENATAVTTVTATDTDVPSQPLTYSIVGGADSARFAINSSTGELTFVAAPDFDLPADAGADNAYNVTVQASDGGLVGTQDIAVTVIPVNDNTPAITSTAGLPVSENSTIVTTITAIDADLPAQPLTYSIAGGADSTLFAVNPSTGELTFTAAPDFEMQKDAGMDNIYNVTVQASDGTFATTQDIAVTITPINDNMPVITSSAGFSISENTTVVTTVTATDADLPAEILTYSIIGGADSAFFTVNPSTGALDFITARDFEMPNDAGSDNIYNLTIQASDGAFTVMQDVTVTIVPVNDNSPVITSPITFSIPENTTTIATLTATDADLPAQSLTYSIVGGADAAKFSIASDTGELKFVTAPDFEVPADFNLDNIHEVAIQVSDGTYNSTQNITVQVANVTNQFPFETAP